MDYFQVALSITDVLLLPVKVNRPPVTSRWRFRSSLFSLGIARVIGGYFQVALSNSAVASQVIVVLLGGMCAPIAGYFQVALSVAKLSIASQVMAFLQISISISISCRRPGGSLAYFQVALSKAVVSIVSQVMVLVLLSGVDCRSLLPGRAFHADDLDSVPCHD